MFSLNVLLPTFQSAMTIKEESIIVTLFCETKIFIICGPLEDIGNDAL